MMITFNYETPFGLKNDHNLQNKIIEFIKLKDFKLGEINYIFCDDEYLQKLNIEFLKHDTLTDIISFDNTLGRIISGDIFISVERVKDNANDFNVSFDNELHRVMLHGVLHFMGYKDKTMLQKETMRNAENDAISFINK